MSRAPDDFRSAVRSAALVYVVAVVVNYPWEIVQSPLYEGMGDLGQMWVHCLVASLGDGVLVLVILAAGFALFGQLDCFEAPSPAGYVAMLVAGLAVGAAVELVAVHVAGRWAYTSRMPVVPGLEVGVVPIAQMVVLPPLVFRIAGRISRRIAQGGTR